MPGFNRRGPEGEGPMTGRGLGKCRKPEDSERDFNEDVETRGQGRAHRFRFRGESGRGRGRGAGRRWL